jgi:hypothetical protein
VRGGGVVRTESVTPRARRVGIARAAHVHRPGARAEFLRGTLVLVTVWALGGLYLSLAPSVIRHVFGIDSGIVNGLAIAVLSGVGAVAPTLAAPLRRARAAARHAEPGCRRGLVAGVAERRSSMPLFFAGTAVAGVGFGARSRPWCRPWRRWWARTNARSCSPRSSS